MRPRYPVKHPLPFLPLAPILLLTALLVCANRTAPNPATARSALTALTAPDRLAPAPCGGQTEGWGWPTDDQPTVTRRFDPPSSPWLPGHRGVDLVSTNGVVRAAGCGVVAFAGTVAGKGVVSVDHPGELRTTYEPVVPLVHTAQSVTRGQALGQVLPGHPDCNSASCLHWGLRSGDEYLDPLSLLRPVRVRLYPLRRLRAVLPKQ